MINNKKKNLITTNVSSAPSKNVAVKKIRPKSSACVFKPPVDKAFNLKKRSKTNINITNSTKNPARNWNASVRPTSATTIKNLSTLPPSYRLGELPYYLKKKPTKAFSRKEIDTKRQIFENWKRKVECGQHELLVSFKNYQEVSDKYPPQRGAEPKEELKLICVVVNDIVEILLDRNTEQIAAIKNSSPKQKYNFGEIEPIKTKLQSIHEHCSKLCENLLVHISVLPSESGDGIVLEKDLLPIATAVETKIRSLHEQMQILKDAAKDLADVSIAWPTGDATDDGGVESKKNEITELTKELEKYKTELSSKRKEAEKQEKTINELKNQLADKNATISRNNVEIRMITNIKSSLEIARNNSEEKYKAIITEQNLTIEKKTKEIEELKSRTTKNITEDIEKQEQYISELEHRKEDAVEKSREINEKYEKLKSELSLREDKIAQINQEMNVEKSSTAAICEELRTIREELQRALKEKSYLEEEKNNLKKASELNINELKMDLFRMKLENNKLQAEKSSMEITLHEKQLMVNKCQKKLDNWKDVESTLDQLKSQIQKIRKCEDEKSTQLQKLTTDLSVAQRELFDRVESNIANERLIRIKNTLITSLPESKSDICDGGSSQVERNNPTIIASTSNRVVAVKDVVLPRLGNETKDISRQENIIKQLEESINRYQRHRKDQEQKIARLEEENLELKYLLCGDQQNDNLKRIQNVVHESTTSQLSVYQTENVYEETNVPTRDWFISHRKEKRQLNVKVKCIDSA